ncbi:MAG: double-strand break repair protein AddB [Rickettsiales bacterium]|nr:double-strand break repair protein AddB [Rickettsiales bacterium]
MTTPKAFYIPADKIFLEELALGILSRFNNISEISILLPSHRSCIEFEKILVRHIKETILLPQVIPIGELGKELQLMEYVNIENTKKHLSEFEHIFYLTNLIHQTTKKKINYTQALDIAISISDIIIRFTRNNISLNTIKTLDFPDVAEHIEEIIEYLDIIAKEWPLLLDKHNTVDFLNDRNIYIEYLIRKWQTTPPKTPIIAAGSTGSIQSTSNLIRTLSITQNCFVVLKSTGFNIQNTNWNNINEHHHNFLTKQLIQKVEIPKQDIVAWHLPESKAISKQDFINTFMSSVDAVENWHSFMLNDHFDTENLQIIECDNLQEEATLITIRIRELLEQNPDSNIAIITNNTDLVQRILIIAKIWNINISNSFGTYLNSTQEYSFIIAILNAVSEKFSPTSLLSLIKHPIFKMKIENLKETIIALETKYLRGIARYDNIEQLIDITKNNNDFQISNLLTHVEHQCANLIIYATKASVDFKILLKELITTSEKLSTYDNNIFLWNNHTGYTLHKCLIDILEASNIGTINFHNIQTVLRTLIQHKTAADDTKSNIKILSSIESRLLVFDHVIISGLNEGEWPAKAKFDPWLTNDMYKKLGLPSPEQTIGQAAYDFFCLLQHQNILLTRSITHNGTTTIPSRWLVKMETLARKIGVIDSIKPQTHYLKKWTKHFLYKPDIQDLSIQYKPKPYALNALHKLSVTKIEKLIRDPYSVYASDIMKIKKLEDVDKQPDQKDFGIFIHSVVDQFNRFFDTTTDHKKLLINIATSVLQSITENKNIKHLWQLKLEKMSDWIINFETSKRQSKTIQIYTEVSGEILINNHLTLTMKADRIEIDQDMITIIDFKTGTIPTHQDINQGFSPQLPLESLIIKKGKTKTIAHTETKNKNIQLIYIQLTPGKNLGKITSINITPEVAIDYIEKNLSSLINQFNSGAPFLISPRINKAPKYNDIAHLEREDN